MARYFGDERTQTLQRKCDEMMPWVAATPGAVANGRGVATEDPDLLGWDVVDRQLAAQGMMVFRLFPRARLGELEDRYGARGYRLDSWDTLVGTAASVRKATAAVLSTALPDGIMQIAIPADPEAAVVTRMQAFLLAQGIRPVSGAFLTGAFREVANVVLTDAEGQIAAVAHANFGSGPASRFAAWAFGGLVAVAPEHRGLGLGRTVNAMMAREAIEVMGASHVFEQVAPANVASRRMVMASGLSPADEFVAAAIMPAGAAKFTR